MADETLTFTLDTGNGEGGDVVIKLRPDMSRALRNSPRRGFTTASSFTA